MANLTRTAILSFTFLIIVCCSHNLMSQTVWTLDSCFKHALKNNYEILGDEMEVKKAQLHHSEVLYSYLPTINGSATHGYNWGQSIDPFTNEFATDRVRTNDFSINSSLNLFEGMQKKNLSKRVKSEVSASKFKLKFKKRNLNLDIAEQYYHLLYLGELVDIRKNRLILTQKLKERVQELIAAEKKPKSDLLELESSEAADLLDVVKAKNKLKYSKLLLKQLLNLPKDYQFNIVMPEEEFELIHGFQQSKLPVQSFAEIKYHQELLEISKKNLQISKGKYYPSLTLSASVGSGYSGNNNTLIDGMLITKPFSTQLSENLYRSIVLNLNIPIFNQRSNSYQVQKTRLEIEKSMLEKSQAQNDVQNEIDQFAIDIENQTAEYHASQAALDFMKNVFNQNKIKYEEGIINFVAFEEAKNKLYFAKSELLQAKFRLMLNLQIEQIYIQYL